MKSAPYLRLVTAAICLGFAGGLWLSSAPRGKPPASISPAIARSATASPDTTSSSVFASEQEAVTAILSAHLEKDRLRRGFELYRALQRVNSSQVAALVERVIKLPAGYRSGLLL